MIPMMLMNEIIIQNEYGKGSKINKPPPRPVPGAALLPDGQRLQFTSDRVQDVWFERFPSASSV